jgi:hypothetical protein
MNFQVLVTTIQQTHSTLQQSALKAVNKHLTIRNWLVGFYIVEFEQKGEDRAKYGENLLSELAKSVKIFLTLFNSVASQVKDKLINSLLITD